MRTVKTVLVSLLALAALAVPAQAGDRGERRTLERYAAGTWASMEAMTDRRSGLPADILQRDGTRSVQTSTTNIGAYLWSAVAAKRTGLINRREQVSKLERTISTLERMEVHEPSGQFYNWYDHRTGAKLTTWPPSGGAITPWLSSVDNGWLAVGLKVVASEVPQLRRRAQALYDSMDFSLYYDEGRNQILFHYVPDSGERACCYDTIVSESRIASYIGIAKGELPDRQYYGPFRAFPSNGCDYGWTETRPVGFTRTYFGVPVYEGGLPYAGMLITPGWGGSMFEALMPTLFVPEERWAPNSWGVNHPLTVDAHIHHGLREAGYGYWGFSPSNNPSGGYREYGVDGISSNPGGYASNNDDTLVDRGYEGCRPPQPAPPRSAYTNGVVTPHAAFLALRYRPEETLANLRALERDFDVYTRWGFLDSVNVDTGEVSDSYLSLDQGMIMAALGNALGHDVMRRAFATRELEQEVRPVIGIEQFSESPRR